MIEKALGMCQRDEEFWCIPEVLRIKGELLQAKGVRQRSARPRNCSCSRLTGPIDRKPYRGNCERHSACPGSISGRDCGERLVIYSRRSTADSLKGSRLPTYARPRR